MTVPPAAVERLRGDLPAALGRAVSADDVIAIAVSGGPDSMALLALAAAAWPGRVIAATVDHGLREAAVDEAAMVAAYCDALRFPVRHPGSVPGPTVPHAPRPIGLLPGGPRNKPGVTVGEGGGHTILRPAKPLGKSNLQANARTARYALLTDWAIGNGATILATAHHADDQAETFLMRAARGSGLAGLSGIRPMRTLSGTLVLARPLLGWRRADLRDIAVAADVPFVDDPSNADDHYDRTRFRRLLTANDWLDPVRLAETAAYAREGNDALEAMIDWLWQERRAIPPHVEDREQQAWLDVAGLPRELIRRLARAAIGSVRGVNGILRPAFSPATNIEPMLDAVIAGTAATQGGILVSRTADIWHFRAAPPRRDTAQTHS